MEYNDDQIFDPIDPIDPVEPAKQEEMDILPVCEEPAPEEAACREPAEDVSEDICWDFPEPQPEPEPVCEEVFRPAPVLTEPEKKPRKRGKKILAAVLAGALLVGSCAVTAGLVNRKWENRMAQMQSQVSTQIAELQEQLTGLETVQSGTSVSGSPLS